MIKSVSRFLKNIGFNMIADLSVRLSKSILIIIISHFLGVSSMGALSIALTYLGFGILFSNWGFGNLLTREIARDHGVVNKYFANYAILRLFFAGIAILLINLIVPHLSYSANTVLVTKIVSISLLATTIVKLYFSIFIAFENIKFISIISFIVNLLRLIISLIILFLNGSIVHVAIIYTASEFLSLLISTILILRYLPEFHIETNLKFAISEIVRAIPFFWIGVLLMLDTRVEIIILSLYFDEAIVGYYTAVNTVLGGLTLFSEGIRNAVFPVVLRFKKMSEQKLKDAVFLLGKYILIITLPLSIITFFFSKEIISLFFGNGFDISITMLKITLWTFISYSLTVVLSGLLMAHDKEKSVAVALFVSGFLTLSLNLILAPAIGVIGVAIVRLITSFLMFFICLYFHFKITGYGIVKRAVGVRIFLGGIVMFAFTYFLAAINKWMATLIGFISFILIIWFARVILTEDLELWRNVTREIFQKSEDQIG